jgi:competence protein ComEA
MIREALQERWRAGERREVVGLVALAILVLTGAAFWYVRSLPRPVAVEMAGAGGRAARASPSPSPKVIVVDVAGWIRRPGVYEFHEGDRVIDAIRRAGGAKQGADLTSVNLAALLTDAEQIVIARKVPGSGPPGSTVTTGSGTSGGGGAGTGSIVNVNTATLDQLETLPGIGEVLAQRILDYRIQHGPFRSADDLLNVSGIGDKRLADLRPMITI